MKINGHIIQDGASYFFMTDNEEKIPTEIGYVKYSNKVDTNVDIGFFDYYPVTEYLLAKLLEENKLCELETKNGKINYLNDKIVIII